MEDERLLVIDESPDRGAFVRTVAEDMGYAVEIVRRIKEFQELYERFRPSAVVIGLILPDGDGIKLLTFLKEQGSDARIVVLSSLEKRVRDLADRLCKAYGLRLVANLEKPASASTLRAALAPNAEAATDI